MVQSSVVTLSLLCLCGSFDSYNISKIHHIGYELIFNYINGSIDLRECLNFVFAFCSAGRKKYNTPLIVG